MATTLSNTTAKKGAGIYTHNNPYLTGDIYDKDQVAISQEQWEINK